MTDRLLQRSILLLRTYGYSEVSILIVALNRCMSFFLTLGREAYCGAGSDWQENGQGGVLKDYRGQCQGGNVGGHIGGSWKKY